jgi:hypothetical protein
MLFNFDSANPMMGGFGLIGMVFYAIFMLVVVAVGSGITIIAVRYMLIATKAAQLYIAKNSPVKAAPAAQAVATTPPTPKAATAKAATPTATTTPTAGTAATPKATAAKATAPATPTKARAPKTTPTP